MKYEDVSNLRDHRGKGKSTQCGQSHRTRLTFVYLLLFFIYILLHCKCCVIFTRCRQPQSEVGDVQGQNIEGLYLSFIAFILCVCSGKTLC